MSNEPTTDSQRTGESMDAAANTLTIVRVFNAPRELVFAAWTDPDQLAQWWGPKELYTPREKVAVDPTVGGTWTATMVMKETGMEFPSTAKFISIDPPRGFEMREEAGDIFPFAVTMTATFEELDGRTTMTVVQHFDVDNFDFSNSILGWGSQMEKLRDLLEG
ncbi:SRPBCC family protein [Arthrobacter sp. ERGS1:01]|uniref:SRPBCC family protein n=1 Tax=Arthrobacter sp. ERGS1:01 TaxID=1704044 RepID=UPI0006B54126|nr:SRPBCC domain-containing protein [Arthrobacter sp. ERGS1:01]